MIVTFPRFIEVVRREKLIVRWTFIVFALVFWSTVFLGAYFTTTNVFPTYANSFLVGIALSIVAFLLNIIWQRDYIRKQTERLWTPLVDMDAYQLQHTDANQSKPVNTSKSNSSFESSSLFRSKVLSLVVYGFGFTLAMNIMTSVFNYFEHLAFSSFWIALIPLYLIKLYHARQSQYFTVDFAYLVYARVGLFVSVIVLGYISPIESFSLDYIDLTGNFSNYILIDDEDYFEDARADVDPVFGGTDASGYYSSFKYYVDKKEDITGLRLPEGIIIKPNDERYYLLSKPYNPLLDVSYINVSPCSSKEVAYIKGYKPLAQSPEPINHFLLPIHYLWFVLLKDGIYSVIYILILIVTMLTKPKLLFS